MKCTIDGCPGMYESDSVVHTVRHAGQVVVIDHVPAGVCSVCGDVLLKPDTVRRIEDILKEQHEPTRTVPLYTSTPDRVRRSFYFAPLEE